MKSFYKWNFYMLNFSSIPNIKPALTYFFLQLLPGTPGQVSDYTQFIEDIVRPAIEVVPGVARVSANLGNGTG